MSKTKILIIAIFLAASALRLADVFRPINQASWRECDEGAISRNFVREGMNPLFPRIDWRGDGPGFVEMELTLYPLLTAATYQVFGVHDQLGRFWSFLFSLGALFFFFKLAREYLTPLASAAALAFFALNPLVVEVSTSIQPEGLMLFAYIAAVYFFVRWLKTGKNGDFWPAVVMTALTLLAKAPSAHIGSFLGVLLIQKYGLDVIKQGKVWIFGVLSVMPSALWYFHAKNLWTTYGNSLGVSNEYHWIGWDFFTDPGYVAGILRAEFLYVWVGFGVIAGAFAIWRGIGEEPAKHSLIWLASVIVFYVLAARTASQDWASYYHVFSIPPAALLFGFGTSKLREYAQDFGDSFSRHSLPTNLGKVVVFFIVIFAIFATFLLDAKQIRASYLNHRVDEPGFVWAEKIKPVLKTDGLIVVSGGHCVDKKGYALAYNASYMFYWLDRKGWNVCIEDQSVANVRKFATKGAKYFVGQKTYLREKPGFEDDLQGAYPTIAESNEFAVFDLMEAK